MHPVRQGLAFKRLGFPSPEIKGSSIQPSASHAAEPWVRYEYLGAAKSQLPWPNRVTCHYRSELQKPPTCKAQRSVRPGAAPGRDSKSFSSPAVLMAPCPSGTSIPHRLPLCDVDSIQCCLGAFCSRSLHPSPKNSSPESSHKSLSLLPCVATCQDESDSCLTATAHLIREVGTQTSGRQWEVPAQVARGPSKGQASTADRQTGQFRVAGALP